MTEKESLEQLFLSNSILGQPSFDQSSQPKSELKDRTKDATRERLVSSNNGNIIDSSFEAIDGSTKRALVNRGWSTIVIHELGETSKRQDLKRALRIWDTFQSRMEDAIPNLDNDKIDELYTKFLRIFLELKSAETAVTVWNFMVKHGHEIGVKHWSAMLQGCARARDLKSLKGIWANMMKAGVAPDLIAWTTYVNGLMKCRQWEEGLQTLHQIGRLWISVEHGKSARDERGSRIALINAALEGLIDSKRLSALDSVLSWAYQQDITLETSTYNILLAPIARTGSLDAIENHLQAMSSQNCQPDATSYTIILSSLLSSSTRSFKALSLAEKEKIIFAIFSHMKESKIPPAAQAYSTVLSALLRPDRSFTAPSQAEPQSSDPFQHLPLVRKVLDHMRENSVDPSSHVYSSLLTHFFSQSPPDLEAVRTLWESISSSSSSPNQIDTVLYDRLIQGLSDNDQTDDALGLFRRMLREGRTPGWLALAKYLDALWRVEDWRGVNWLVKKVENPDGFSRWAKRELRAQGRWDSSVAQLRGMGVLDEEDHVDGQQK